MRDASQSISSGATGASSKHIVPFDGALLSYLPVAAWKGLYGTANYPRASALPYISQTALGANHVSATWILTVTGEERGSHDPFFTGDTLVRQKKKRRCIRGCQ